MLSINCNFICLHKLFDEQQSPCFARLLQEDRLKLVAAWHNCKTHKRIVPTGIYQKVRSLCSRSMPCA